MLRVRSASTMWLIGIIASAALLIVIAVVINLVSDSNQADLLPADTPEGVGQRYLIALNDDDGATAFGYISSSLTSCTLTHFIQTTGYQREQNYSVSLGKTTTTDKATLVAVKITDAPSGDLFGQNGYSYDVIFTLKEEADGWRFSEPPWPMSWCPEPPKSSPEATPERLSLAHGAGGSVMAEQRWLTWNS
jgi:hypothetical protein